MSHDLDDALRDSLRRHAEDAPTALDPERIRARSRRIRRRRVAESVAAAFAVIVVVGGVALAVGSLRTDAGPGPVTSVPPTVSPAPTGSAPATTSPSPTTSSAVSSLGWVATNPRGASGAHPPRTLVVVTTGTGTVVVATVDNAIARPLGWYGSDRRTLVWEEGNGDPGLQAVTFRADGTPAERSHPLALPGVTPSAAGAGSLFGATVAVPGGGFVIWSEGTGPHGTSEYIRVDDSLRVVSRTPAADESGLLAASRDAFVTAGGSRLTTYQVVVHSGNGVTRADLPTTCEGLSGGPMSGDGGDAPLWCAAPPSGTTGAVRVLDVTSRAFTSSVLDAVGPATFWWDGPTLHASTATQGGWSRWLLTGARWSPAPDGTPVDRVLSGGVVLMRKATGDWYAETDPEIALDSQDAPVVRSRP